MEISSLYTSAPKIMIICYTVPDVWCMINVIIFHFGPFFVLSQRRPPPFPPPPSPLLPLTARKIRILKKQKKSLEIASFYTSVSKIMITCYTVPDIWCVINVIINYFSFWAIFCPFTPPPPNSPKNQNLKKMKKTACRYHHFIYVYQNL